MNKIYKYTLPVQEKYAIDLPKRAQIIRVEDIDGLFYLWAIVNPEAETEKRYLEFYKTGQPIETPLSNLQFLGTCKLFIMQELCLYVFENINPVICTDNSLRNSEPIQ
jgi:hypothetical protein